MIPAEFDYHKARSLDEAIALLGKHGDAKLLAGGQSLIPAMRFRLAAPATLIDISGLKELEYIKEDGSHLLIGALTRESALEESALVRASYLMLFDTAKVIADPLVRNRATVGGNLAHADPANDHPATMLAYGASIIARGPKGTRTIAIDDFFVGLFESKLEKNEVLQEIRIPKPVANGGGAYLKVERKVGDYAVSGVAVNLVLAGDTIQSARMATTNVGPVPMRSKNADSGIGPAVDSRLNTDHSTRSARGAAAASRSARSPSHQRPGSISTRRCCVGRASSPSIRAISRSTGSGASSPAVRATPWATGAVRGARSVTRSTDASSDLSADEPVALVPGSRVPSDEASAPVSAASLTSLEAGVA